MSPTKLELTVEQSLEFAQLNAQLDGFEEGVRALAQVIRTSWIKNALAKRDSGKSPDVAQSAQGDTHESDSRPAPSATGGNDAASRNRNARWRGPRRAAQPESGANGHDHAGAEDGSAVASAPI